MIQGRILKVGNPMSGFVLFLVVFALMALADTFDTCKTRFMVEDRRILGFHADFLVEVGNFAWMAAGIDSVIQHGLSLELGWVVAGMYFGSAVGFIAGEVLSHWLARKVDKHARS